MNVNSLDKSFDPQTLADDLLEVRRIYEQFLSGLDEENWDKPVKGGSNEWTLHETLAHLVAWNRAGVEGIQHILRGEPYSFTGLETRYEFNAYNRTRINEHLHIPLKELGAELLGLLSEAANIARSLQPGQTELALPMAIYNRPVKIIEALSILLFHTGLVHTAQVAEPAGRAPLWMQLSPEIRHRMVGRTMRAFSLLYRDDIGGSLRAAIAFRIGGPGGGEWYVHMSPEAATSGEGIVDHPQLVIQMRDTGVFCQMLTSRLILPLALISGAMRLRGNLRLFLRMDTLFSVDARPKAAVEGKVSSSPQGLAG